MGIYGFWGLWIWRLFCDTLNMGILGFWGTHIWGMLFLPIIFMFQVFSCFFMFILVIF